MTVKWSPHAQELLGTILDDIVWNLHPEDAERWNGKIVTAACLSTAATLLGTDTRRS